MSLEDQTSSSATGKKPNPPRKHHFIPQFLLGQWTTNDGKLWRFMQPAPGKIAVKSVSPAEIGYEEYLYATPGLPPEKAQQVEQHFMSPLDSLAADAQQMLLAGQASKMPQKERSSWSRFIMSQWFRTPAGLSYFKEAMGLVLKARDEPLNARYQEIRKEGDPERLEDAIAALGPDFAEGAAMDLLRRMSDDPKLGHKLNNMRWFVVDILAGDELLISDAAFQQSQAGILSPQGYMTIPIAPRKLFVAVTRQSTADAIRAIPVAELARRNNSAVVRHASIFVGATDRSQEGFIREHFGKEEHRTMIRSLAEEYRSDAKGGEDSTNG
ncbi:MAG: DUF4238 domain-containing protein [Brevundimonas sp.]|uniref:DUF4238 domain-containing protein n=1 Tax=Brevundimonas sp. TaxID=1871086 RepID=UPI0024883740|nr:DUF4238 domain-containing protein [Brevundimonas sp.]MDI1326076.1 DUF4238 domain-containing protein [Brevundimonas sp.]